MDQEGKLSDRICRQITRDIETGKFVIGKKLPPEPELMKLYKVGRSTIREAIRDLVISGALKVRQGAGTTIIGIPNTEPLDNKLKRADFEEINAVRKLLEKEITILAIDRHTSSHLEEIERCLIKRRAAIEKEDRTACMEADIGFHLAIAAAAGNGVLAELYQSFTNIIRCFFGQREMQGVSRFALTHYLHEQLYKCIETKNQEEAERVLQQILNNNY